jgi:hypothetical protein
LAKICPTLMRIDPNTSWPSLENIFPELKTVLPNADFVIEGYVDPPSHGYGVTSPTEPLRDEGPFGGHTRYSLKGERKDRRPVRPLILFRRRRHALNEQTRTRYHPVHRHGGLQCGDSVWALSAAVITVP